MYRWKIVYTDFSWLYIGLLAKVIYSYHAQNEDELTLTEGQTVTVLDQNLEDAGWWRGDINGRTGVFPDNFVELMPQSTKAAPQAMVNTL